MDDVLSRCPTCDGRKEGLAFVDGPGLHELLVMKCMTCKGEGLITEAHMQRIEAGKLLRMDRLAQGLSQREMAEKLGMPWMEYNHLELGKQE
jgi:hypothetical protein